MDLLFRHIIKSDQAFLWEILYLALFVQPGAAPFPREILNEPTIKRYAESWGRAGDIGVFACLDNQPIAGAWVRLWSGADKGYGYVSDSIPELTMATLPQYRNQGVGGALLEELVKQIHPLYPGISCSVANKNPARRLYVRSGFEVVKTEGQSVTLLKTW